MDEKNVRLIGPELDEVLDLCLEGALARRKRGEEVSEPAIAILRRLQAAAHDGPARRVWLETLLPRLLKHERPPPQK